MAKSLFKNLILLPFILLTFSGCSFLGIRIGSKESRSTPQAIVKKNIGGIFKSTDKGETFEHKVKIIDKKSIDKINVAALLFDPQDTLTLYLLSKKNGLWVTYNGAESWEQLLNQPLQTIALDNKKRGIIYAAKETELIRSIDGGSTWETIFIETSGQSINTLAVDPQDSKHILTVTRNGFIFETTDQGKSWKLLTSIKTKNVQKLIINPKNSREIYLATVSEGLFKSTNGGKKWNKIDYLKRFQGSENLTQFKLNPNIPSHLYLASKYGILKSTDSGKTWHNLPLLTPRSGERVLSIGFNPYNEQEFYYATRSSFFRSWDGAETWDFTELPTSRYPTEILVDAFDTNIIYIGISSN